MCCVHANVTGRHNCLVHTTETAIVLETPVAVRPIHKSCYKTPSAANRNKAHTQLNSRLARLAHPGDGDVLRRPRAIGRLWDRTQPSCANICGRKHIGQASAKTNEYVRLRILRPVPRSTMRRAIPGGGRELNVMLPRVPQWISTDGIAHHVPCTNTLRPAANEVGRNT